MSLVATSHRRRSVRSRRHQTRPSMGGLPTRLAPISSTSFHPVGVLTRSSMGEPTLLSRTLSSDEAASSRSSGWRKSRAFSPTISVAGKPKTRSAAGLAQTRIPSASATTTASGNSKTRRSSHADSIAPSQRPHKGIGVRGRLLNPWSGPSPQRPGTGPSAARSPAQRGCRAVPGGAGGDAGPRAEVAGPCLGTPAGRSGPSGAGRRGERPRQGPSGRGRLEGHGDDLEG